MSANLIHILQKDLTKFGLDPAEWSLQLVNRSYFKILHKTDSSFGFFGYLEFKNAIPGWKALEVFSI